MFTSQQSDVTIITPWASGETRIDTPVPSTPSLFASLIPLVQIAPQVCSCRCAARSDGVSERFAPSDQGPEVESRAAVLGVHQQGAQGAV